MKELICPACEDSGHVCEDHPNLPWDGVSNSNNTCKCGGAGMPCKMCCSEVPKDCMYSAVLAFVPDKFR